MMLEIIATGIIVYLFVTYDRYLYYFLKYLWHRHVNKEGWWISMSEDCFELGDVIKYSGNLEGEIIKIEKNKNFIKYYIIRK